MVVMTGSAASAIKDFLKDAGTRLSTESANRAAVSYLLSFEPVDAKPPRAAALKTFHQDTTAKASFFKVGEYCILREEAVVRVPRDAKATDVAPLLCAGVTLFNSLRHHGVKPGETVVIQGVGGLGHLGIQYARKMGFRVVVLSRTSSKEADARELGAHHFICSESADVAAEVNKLGAAKLIIVTAPNSNVEQYTKCLQWQGKIVILACKLTPLTYISMS